MERIQPKLLLTSSPFLKDRRDTPYIMRQVIYSLVPVMLAAIYYFGLQALLVMVTCILGAVLSEWALALRGKSTLKDGTAVLTGLLLALILPPGIPLWMAFLGAVVAIMVGKLIFGGVGGNIFNPALVGRAFLQAAFPVAITTWMKQDTFAGFSVIRGETFTMPFLKSQVAAMTTATPLAQMKFEGELAAFNDLLLGNTAGSLGETSSLMILLGGVYLASRNVLNWRIPLGVLGSVYALSALLHVVDAGSFAPPHFHLLAGGLMFGAVFMATDPVTSPITQRGCWLFAVGIGVLVVVIRNFGGLPEGVMYAILLMNAVTPLLNRITPQRVFGEKEREKATG